MIPRIHTIWRFSGVAGVIVLWTTTIIGMRRVGIRVVDDRPISHLGIESSSAVLFSVGLLISSALFILFALYVRKAYRPDNRFLSYFLIGQMGQVLVAIIPYGANSPHKLIHTLAAFTLAFSLPFLIHRFARTQQTSKNRRIFTAFIFLELLLFVVGMGIFTMTRGIAPLGEVLPAAGFHVWIIGLTWLAQNGKTKSTAVK